MSENQVKDGYETYFTEKLWQMIPAVYRDDDSRSQDQGILRSLIEVMAEQAAILRRSQDRLWEDQLADFCSPDVSLPLLADLVGTRILSDRDTRGQKIDVVKTITYLRRAGTLPVLEMLLGDITGWGGTVVENFRRLGRTRHRLDPHPAGYAGRITGTLPGGFADLRKVRGADLVEGPFDEYHYTADVRKHQGGLSGRYGLSKLSFHLYTKMPFKVEKADCWKVTEKIKGVKKGSAFTIDPSGRDIPLYMPSNRSKDLDEKELPYNWDNWTLAKEWNIPGPVPCRLMAELVNKSEIKALSRILSLEEGPFEYGIGHLIPWSDITIGRLEKWITPVQDARVVIDPRLGRILFTKNPPAHGLQATYHYGFSTQIGAGTYDRPEVEIRNPDYILKGGGAIPATVIAAEGVTQISNNKTYGPVDNRRGIKKLVLQAANRQRPYIRLESDWILTADENSETELLLDGLWIGNEGQARLVLEGSYERVTLSHMTLDPGGLRSAGGDVLDSVTLVVRGNIDLLKIEHSILGKIQVENNGLIEELDIKDSILYSGGPDIPVMSLQTGIVKMNRVSVFGSMEVHRLSHASELLTTGIIKVKDVQIGCFRFSAARKRSGNTESRLPRQYRAHWIGEGKHIFQSERFGDPDFCQLSEIAPEELLSGAENSSEIGAFNSMMRSIKLNNLKLKANEYMRFGLVKIFIRQT